RALTCAAPSSTASISSRPAPRSATTRPPTAATITSTPPAWWWCPAEGGASFCEASRNFEPRDRHPRPLLSAAARESLAGVCGGPGLGGAVPRLERARHGRVLRAEHGGPAGRRHAPRPPPPQTTLHRPAQ